MQRAWEELEGYMAADEEPPAAMRTPGTVRIPEHLRKDFRNLEVSFGAPLPDVQKSYKRLMTAFHPDRHSADPERYRTATEVTKKLNQSFQRIRAFYEVAE
jgi:DnaJ-domain-containing protein 1